MVLNGTALLEGIEASLDALWFVSLICICSLFFRSATPVGSVQRYKFNTIFLSLFPFAVIQMVGDSVLLSFNGKWISVVLNILTLVMLSIIRNRVKKDDNDWFSNKKKKLKQKADSLRERRFGVGVTTGSRW